MAEIVLDRVSKRYPDGTTALRKASFTIREGEFFVLVGPSGCGKSTLLHLIVGLEEITDGEIRIDGRRINDLDPSQRNMAMVFQSYALYPHMTVRENLAFPLKLARLPRDEICRRVEEAAALLEISEWLDRKPAKLSGGQRQRVAMGRAIVRRPAVFLLDEPLSNLDARLRVQMRVEIARLQRRLGVTTVYVTHDQTEAMILADRAAVLQGGETQQVGTPRELYERPRNVFVAGFIGSPAMNFFPARLSGGQLQTPIGSCRAPGGLPAHLPVAAPLIAGLRPEHLRLAADGAVEATFSATVDRVEWLGAELYVHFRLPVPDWAKSPNAAAAAGNFGGAAIARIDPGRELRSGDRVTFRFDPGKLHLFDADTQVNLAAGGGF